MFLILIMARCSAYIYIRWYTRILDSVDRRMHQQHPLDVPTFFCIVLSVIRIFHRHKPYSVIIAQRHTITIIITIHPTLVIILPINRPRLSATLILC